MSAFQDIRKLLEMTQAEMAGALSLSQSSISFYENGKTVPPDVASKLIEVARERGHSVSFDQVYADLRAPAPEADRAAA